MKLKPNFIQNFSFSFGFNGEWLEPLLEIVTPPSRFILVTPVNPPMHRVSSEQEVKSPPKDTNNEGKPDTGSNPSIKKINFGWSCAIRLLLVSKSCNLKEALQSPVFACFLPVVSSLADTRMYT